MFAGDINSKPFKVPETILEQKLKKVEEEVSYVEEAENFMQHIMTTIPPQKKAYDSMRIFDF